MPPPQAAASGRRLGRLLRFLGVRHGQRAEHLLELGHPRIETHHLDALAHRAGREREDLVRVRVRVRVRVGVGVRLGLGLGLRLGLGLGLGLGCARTCSWAGISGPLLRPVSATRRGMKRPLPLRPST